MRLANLHLQRLDGGRYLLARAGAGLALSVLDTWQADARRDTRTLSGGESFLVSLALALGLSDLVSHKTRIDSFFLDEGFGSLDPDSLDVALDALDSLNAHACRLIDRAVGNDPRKLLDLLAVTSFAAGASFVLALGEVLQ